MFHFLGRMVSRYWYLFLVGWLALLVGTYLLAPPWDDVAQDREFAFLPADAPSRQSEAIFQKAFPVEHASSNIVLVVSRSGDVASDVKGDREFIENVLEPGLRSIVQAEGGLAGEAAPSEVPLFSSDPTPAKPTKKSIVLRIRTPNAPGTGPLLISADGKMMLVVLELTTEFLSKDNWPTITSVENLVTRLRTQGQLPRGVDIAVTGSAVIGRDHTDAQLQAIRDTGLLTVVLVVVLLLIIYQAPLLTVIPLLAVFISVELALNILAILAGHGYITLFQGIQIYITILAYGAGVDYCLFLTARYREALDGGGVHPADAVAGAIGSVGHALTASAGTVICGIGMMIFARFGKFREAGYAIPLSLFFVLASTLTFSPALFRLAGRWTFWPHVPGSTPALRSRWLRWLPHSGVIQQGWVRLENALLRRPGAFWLGTVALMLPFVIAALLLRGHVSYDMVGDLPADAPSVVGTRILREHMPAGMMGPVGLLIVDKNVDFRKPEGRAVIDAVSRRLQDQQAALGIADMRSFTAPLGVRPAPAAEAPAPDVPDSVRREAIAEAARDYYLTDLGGRNKVGARFDVILQQNPFSDQSIEDLQKIEQTIREVLGGEGQKDAQLYAIGPTASVHDLQQVIGADRLRIQVLVTLSVCGILIILLRQVLVPVYLLLSVLFSYFATLGVTFALFWALDPKGFTGIDWKVAVFLFTILVAVGEDYNIFLMTRIDEETQARGPLRGVTDALTRTGPIISSCGIIMAGTFASLLIGRLSEMKQLGFALAFGVLLDTFVVRPILVPAFLLLLRSGRLWPFPAAGQPEALPPSQVTGWPRDQRRADLPTGHDSESRAR